MEFAEVHDHPDNPGEYLTEDELKAYLEEKESQAQKARQKKSRKQRKKSQTTRIFMIDKLKSINLLIHW